MKIKDLPKIDRPQNEHPSAGHRKRLRERFLRAGLDGFGDYEIVELLLTLGTPMRDCKQMAKEAIKEFGGLRGVLDASYEELQKIKGLGPHNIFGLKFFQALSKRYSKEKLPRKITFDSPQAVISFLQEKIGQEPKEHFLILSLNTRNNLIRHDEISIGTLNASIVHPREVFKTAIQALAANIIVAHNHPSGDSEPSREDIEITVALKEAGKIIGIEVLDHIIVAREKTFSFKNNDLIV
ncbi:hypothetical protein A3D60_03435 [Candidatus Uhrbacteria bacterium RIFCSPHIGHO2_02_FULL_47_29]|uniref:MPN domain-containing protein n=2 Tax=Patescibacteria group TaxID=1783273 RepID=A0A1F7UYK8_9BACT|nr:MAG: repair protein RadC protein [Parcubacteria group bacterium GW2011_GWA2_46_9]OGD89006.1 MAG: hypothetical protein A2693_00445 [Candidatus Curtissbacteria bacterium RIFCSPHIGHO2_01_FULL_40_12]OGL70088.1 MAG: hypothetical protein A3D60_03435 [Candidatus Uhrbacteria bacterium RIFCSPHIGHO2_02_FULL_47_29]OGL82848.1 MAG: hypothetical protein A2936_04255 [Candidatus Uhrbacteria bacterium RIFCSPLOWO2_01_FULL_47_25]OGL84564.1 MAG: hypothetical protein A3I37_02385 [Candidatus Uhrbacteria bacterium